MGFKCNLLYIGNDTYPMVTVCYEEVLVSDIAIRRQQTTEKPRKVTSVTLLKIEISH